MNKGRRSYNQNDNRGYSRDDRRSHQSRDSRRGNYSRDSRSNNYSRDRNFNNQRDNKFQGRFDNKVDIYPTKVTKLDLVCNYFKVLPFSESSESLDTYKYSVDIDPEVPVQMYKKRKRIFKKVYKEVKEYYGLILYEGHQQLYGKNMIDEIKEFTANEDQADYTVKIKFVSLVEKSELDYLVFHNLFFKQVTKNLELHNIGNKYFSPKSIGNTENLSVELLSGYSAKLSQCQTGTLLNLDVSHKVLRNDTALDVWQKYEGHEKSKAKAELAGAVVVTRYNNNKTYVVTDIDDSKTPASTFTIYNKQTNQKEAISYADYLKDTYNCRIENQDQPLLKIRDKKTKIIIYLIPELCYMTGLDDKMRNDFNLTKELSQVTHLSAKDRMDKICKFFQMIKGNAGCEKTMNFWNLQIDQKPLEIQGTIIPPGNFEMGLKKNPKNENDKKRTVFSSCGDQRTIDREIQNFMYANQEIKKWAVMFERRNEKLYHQYRGVMDNAIKAYQFTRKEPIVYKVDKEFDMVSKLEEIEDELKDIDIIVIIISGKKKNNSMYNELKRVTMNQYQVPTQFINYMTIQKNKNLMSICCRILMQINSKIGGAPWKISDVPFTDKPIIIVGISVYKRNKRSDRSIL